MKVADKRAVLTVFEERENLDQRDMPCIPSSFPHFPGGHAELRNTSVEIQALNPRIMILGHLE